MAELHNNRWVAGPDDFAVRVELADVSGFFSKTLTIEPGVRALFLERGVSVGEAAAEKEAARVIEGIVPQLRNILVS